ncbi:MAG: alpha/beta hydrolase [Actinobacteria bacterium]|nr:alpha/beta hydrolase [Actinomycetota bacterium]
MSDHPVLLPTPDGPVGANVTEPEGHRRGAAVILEGIGGRRFGVNRLWSRTAWALSDLGLVVLRIDYPGSGDSAGVRRGRRTEEVVLEAVRWFRDRTRELDLQLVGACYGANLAARVAREEPRLSRLILVTPHLRKIPSRTVGVRVRRLMGGALPRTPRPALDRRVCGAIAAAARKAGTVAIAGELDGSLGDMIRLRAMVHRSGGELSIDLVPKTDLHGHRTLHAQRETVTRIVAEAGRGLEEAGGGQGEQRDPPVHRTGTPG